MHEGHQGLRWNIPPLKYNTIEFKRAIFYIYFIIKL